MGNMVRLSLLLLVATLVCGCAKSNFVALVPDPEGKTGSITVSNEAGSIAIDVPYRATTIKDAKEPPGPLIFPGKETLEKQFEEALSIQPQRPRHFLLHFSEETRLTSRYLKLLPKIIAAIGERNSGYISVIGHTDTVASAEYNLELSRKRALTVKNLLVRRGVCPNNIETAWRGEKQLLFPTADEVYEPRNRRVEVIVR